MLVVLMMDFLRVLFRAAFTKEVDRIIIKYIVPIVQPLAHLLKFKR